MGARRRRRIAIFGVALALCPLLAAGESIQAERELGKRFALEAARNLPLLRDPEVITYVNGIGQRLIKALGAQPFAYRFYVVSDARINAFAVPGGYVYVNTGLLLQIGNDDELAGVLGHEIAHVHAHHLARQQEGSKLLNYAALLGLLASVVQPALGAAALGATAAMELKYRREFEQEADYLGSRYVQQAGFDPRGMLDFLNKLWEEQRTTPTFMPPFLLTHPLSDERLNNLEAVLGTKQWQARPRPPASADLLGVQLLARVRSQPAPEVVEEYRRGVRAHPQEVRRRFLLGSALLETGAYEAARDALKEAKELGCRGVDRQLGRVFLRLGALEKARAALARATTAKPADPVAQAEYGRVLEALGKGELAAAAYRRAVELAPEFGEAHYQLGMLAGRAGRRGEGFFELALAARLRGDYAAAVRQFETAITELSSGPMRGEAKRNVAELRAFLRQAGSQP